MADRMTAPTGSQAALHKPEWYQSRDDQYGQWNCACGKTFAPDDLHGYWRHIAATASQEQAPAAWAASAPMKGNPE